MYYFNLTESQSGLGKPLFEYLYFFLSDKPLYAIGQFDQEYLEFLKEDFSIYPEIKKYQKNLGLKNFYFNEEPEWSYQFNSKIEFAKFCLEKNIYDHDVKIISFPEQNSDDYIYKSEFGFSGKGVKTYPLVSFPQVQEERLERIKDFSIYFFDTDQYIIYENFIDRNFQYKGSSFNDDNVLSINKFLSLDVESYEIQKFLNKIKKISSNIKTSFSLDCFTYQRNGEIRIHPGCEVNIRKTMGSMFYHIWKKYFQEKTHMSFVVEKMRDDKQTLSPKNQSFFINYKF